MGREKKKNRKKYRNRENIKKMADVINSLAKKASSLVDNLVDQPPVLSHVRLQTGNLTSHDLGDSLRMGLVYGAAVYTLTDIFVVKQRQRTWQEKLIDFGGFVVSGVFICKFLKTF